MPKKKILTAEQVIDSAYLLVKREGVERLNSRSLARETHTSTQPLFSLFPGMAVILKEVKDKAFSLYDSTITDAIQSESKPFKAVGIAYIRFAENEANLFKLLFMTENDQTYAHFNIDHHAASIIEDVEKEYGLTEEYARRLYFESWIATHGLASLLATKTLLLKDSEISTILDDVVRGTYEKLKREMENKYE